MGSSAYRKVARTFRAIAKNSQSTKASLDTSKATGGSLFQSYTISRENSFSPDYEDFDCFVRAENKLKDDPDISDDSGTGRSTGLGSLSSSAPREELAREMLRQATSNATRNSFRSSQTGLESSPVSSAVTSVETSGVPEVIEVQTVGQLRRPSLQLSAALLQSTPLGEVPGRGGPSAGSGGHPGLGIVPGQPVSSLSLSAHHTAGADYDETEPLESLTNTSRQQGNFSGDFDETESLDSLTFTRPRTSQTGLGQATLTMGSLSATNSLAGHHQLGTVPSLSGQLGTVPSLSGQLGTVPSLGGHPQFGTVPSLSGQLGTVPSLTGHPQLGTVPSLTGQLGTVPSLTGHSQLGTVPGQGLRGRTLDFDQLSSWSSRDDFSLEEEFNISSSDRGENFKGDSGVISGEYSDVFRNPDIDTLSDGGFADMAAYPGIRLGSEVPSDPLSIELEDTLKHLNPAEVERRRQLMGRNYRCVCSEILKTRLLMDYF